MQKSILFVYILLITISFSCSEAKKTDKSTSEVAESFNAEQKPWTRWWWMGSAVDSINIRQNLIDLNNVGIGGVEIAPIYGVKGEEDNFIDYLSPKWMNMLSYTTKVADSLGMGVDLTLGTGWPYGGPQVTTEFAATKLITQKYVVEKGQTSIIELVVKSPKDKETALFNSVLAYGNNGEYKDLTQTVENNKVSFTANETDYTIYLVFTGKTRQQVKRAAPGAKGLTLDHYSEKALNVYLESFDKAFQGFNGNIRSIFNDSYEVYQTDFTPDFFKAFKRLRGYDLKPYLPLVLSEEETEENFRVKSDYRETLSDLLHHDFDEPWTAWANKNNFKSRLQAHGSPGNLIDLYAAADIPECETFGSMPYDIVGLRREKEDIREGDADPVMLKFSSSAAHIAGKPLTSSETFTWLRDHFKTALSQTKPEVEDLFLNGINHIFLHGTTYSPKRAAWPGWKFYASVNFNPNLAIGEDENELFAYIKNCQSFLQAGQPANDVLLYWPIYDVWNSHLKGSLFFQFKIHSLDEWLHNQPFYDTTKKLLSQGYSLDFISDNFIEKATFSNNKIVLPGGSYKSLVIPKSTYMPLKTLKKLLALKEQGANIIFEDLPESVPGFDKYKEENKIMKSLLVSNNGGISKSTNIFKDLNAAGVKPEKLVETGLKYIKRVKGEDDIYYIVNHTAETVDQFIPVNSNSKDITLYNPNTDIYGKAQTKEDGDNILVRVQIKSGESLVLTTENLSKNLWNYYQTQDGAYDLNSDWKITFLHGGPSLPAPATFSKLSSWTKLNEASEHFSGTAKYEISFNNPDENISSWLLQLGEVRESAKIWLNDIYVGALWSNPFEIHLEQLKKGKNKLTIEVTNLSANRIRAKEMRGEEWKNFYEINMVNKDYEKFDATKWQPMPSGILGPVKLIPLKKD